jgi:hypothetical protein
MFLYTYVSILFTSYDGLEITSIIRAVIIKAYATTSAAIRNRVLSLTYICIYLHIYLYRSSDKLSFRLHSISLGQWLRFLLFLIIIYTGIYILLPPFRRPFLIFVIRLIYIEIVHMLSHQGVIDEYLVFFALLLFSIPSRKIFLIRY